MCDVIDQAITLFEKHSLQQSEKYDCKYTYTDVS